MKTLHLTCGCGGLCHTTLKCETDTENPKNIYFSIKNDKYDLESFISLDRESSLALSRYIKSKFKE
jgi:hypothetical protein